MTFRRDDDLVARAGAWVNLADFARLCAWNGAPSEVHVEPLPRDAEGRLVPMPLTGEPGAPGGWQLGLEWAVPRDVSRVAVTYAGAVPPDVRVEYWQHVWPTPAPERLPGARRGWIGRDDPWHGRWVTVRAARALPGETCTFDFDPVDHPELPWLSWEALSETADYLAPFRRTLKLRLISGGEVSPLVTHLEVTGSARWCERSVDLEFGLRADPSEDWSGEAVVAEGHLLGVEPFDSGAGLAVDPSGAWRCPADGRSRGVRLHLLVPDATGAGLPETLVTLRTRARVVTVRVADLDVGPIYVPDYGIYVTAVEHPVPLETFLETVAQSPRPIYDRVFDEPEQSLVQAMTEIPPLDAVKQDSGAGMGRYLPLALEAGRQEFALRHTGELLVDKAHLKLSGRDAARLLWPGPRMRFRFGSGDPPDFREPGYRTEQTLLEGWLPVVISRWVDREIAYKETAFVAPLSGTVLPFGETRGDEDVVALVRFEMRNTTAGRKRAQLWLAPSPQEALELQDGRFIAAEGRVVPDAPVARQWRTDAYPKPRLRCVVTAAEGEASLSAGVLAVVPFDEDGGSRALSTAVLYSVDLEPGASQTVTLAFPFATPDGSAAWEAIAALDFDTALTGVVEAWHAAVASGGQMEVPEPVLVDFHRSARVHVGITTDRDPVNGLYVVPAATWSYGACGNEACWQITMLDQAGHHDRAAAYLETFLQTQGVAKPDGRFESAEGALLALDFDGGSPVMGHFAYNLDHGFIMECLADHYRYSGDDAWLNRVAPKLVAACDFVIRERAATMVEDARGRRDAAWGLLPAGHLEDNPEWRHWFAVNAHAYAGMRAIAEVLGARPEGAPGQAEAARLTEAAAAYREDIRAAALRAMAEAPVVRLLDGTYVPHIPTRAHLRGREWGWFREAAYGALHLLEGGVFAPDAPEMTWVLKDLEDNLFVSREWGRPVDLDWDWFSLGGITIQPNLMDLAIDYLRRGEIKHALRALFNNFGVSLYPDVRTFTEHPVVEPGHGVGPFYKSSDESKALVWLRHCLLHEEGDALHLALGVPRVWFAPGQSFAVRAMASFFGPVSYEVAATAERVTVRVVLDAVRSRPAALNVHLRLPGGLGPRVVRVNHAAYVGDVSAGVVAISSPPANLEIEADL